MARFASLSESTRAYALAAYVLPFAVFLLFLTIRPFARVPQWAQFATECAILLTVSRSALKQAPAKPVASLFIGLIVFFVWIAPDQLFSEWRSLPVFHNAVVGAAAATTSNSQRVDVVFLLFRVLNSVIAIPLLEELFWRGFLMRRLIDRDFQSVPLGAYRASAFWAVAVLFAAEHGPYWDVGLIAGIVYNAWMWRTRNLWDCVLAHATTNACLAWYVIHWHQWQYWL